MGELICEVTFCELRCKQVINVVDGKCLGHIIDIVFDLKCGRILGLVTPGFRRWLWFRPREDIFIPWRHVCKIGDDVILVELKPLCGAPVGCFTDYSGRGGGRYGAEFDGAVKAEGESADETVRPDFVSGPSGAGPAPSNAEARRRPEHQYQQYYDVYDVPDKEQ